MAQVVGIHRLLHDYDQIVVYQDGSGNIKSNRDSAFTLPSPSTPGANDIIGLYNYASGSGEVVVYQDGSGNVKSNKGIT